MDNSSLSHTRWKCQYHIVFIPKYRRKVMYGQVKSDMREILMKLCEYKKVEIIQGAVCRDHVHLCVSIPPKFSVAEVVGTIKGKSAIRMFNKFPDLRKQYWGSHFWSRGYYVNTVGINEETIKQYIKDQDKLDRLTTQGKLF